jgi:hypothetical protein
METEAYQMVQAMEKLIMDNNAMKAWNMQKEFARVWNSHKPESPERKAMAVVWEKAMDKWH